MSTAGAGTKVRFEPVSRLRGTVTPPPDKSISHRAALLAAMAEDPVGVRNYLDAGDTNSTLEALRELGMIVEQRPDEIVVRGGGLRDIEATWLRGLAFTARVARRRKFGHDDADVGGAAGRPDLRHHHGW